VDSGPESIDCYHYGFVLLCSLASIVCSKKKAAPPLEVAARFRNFVRLLVGQSTRARFAGPLPPKEEAVRKGEIARVQFHSALLATIQNIRNNKLKRHYTKRSRRRQAPR